MLVPVGLVFILWALAGFNQKGGKEAQLWLIFIASLSYFKVCNFRDWFEKSFIYLSALQAFVVATFLFSENVSAANQLSSSQVVRDLLGEHFGVHPTYMGAVWLWAAFLALSRADAKIIFRAMAVVLILGSAIAAGKMPFVAFILMIPALFYNKNYSKKHKLLLGLFLIGFTAALFVNNSYINERFQELKTISITQDFSTWQNATTLRMGIWRCTISEINEHLWSGVGLGNTRETLDQCYKSYKNDQFFSTEFNTHNQLAHYALAGGIMSAIIIFSWWIWLAYRCLIFRGLTSTTFWFMVYATAIMFTENYLTRQHGMMFISLMLLHHYPSSFFLTPPEQTHTS